MTHVNFRDLRYLVAVADLQHFGRAAAACYVSQPTLSTQIKKLEQYLGVQLVERTSKRVMVTPVGRMIAERARRVLNEVEDIVETARAAGDPLAGELRLGLIPTLGPYLIPHLFPVLREACPRLRVLLHEERTEGLLERLRGGALDAAIMAAPVAGEGLRRRALFREPFHVALPAGHRLAARQRLRLRDLEAESMLLLEEGHCLRDQALDVCSMVGAREELEFRATSLETLRQMVASGAGMTLLPALAAGACSSGPAEGLVLRPFEGEAPAREIVLYWRRGCAREAAVEAIGGLVAGLEPVRGLELPLAAEG